MEKSLSKVRRALTVFTFLFVALFIVFATLYVIAPVLSGGQIGDNLTLHFNLIVDGFKAAFGQGAAENMLLGIVNLVFCGLTLILIILGIVYTCKKRKGLFSLFSLALIVNLYVMGLFVPLFYAIDFKSTDIGVLVYAISTFAVAVLSSVACFVTYIFGLVYAKRLFEAAMYKEEEDSKTIAEMAGDPEAVQESEELGELPAEPLVVESEPEPVEEDSPVEEEVVAPIEEAEEVVEPLEEPVEEPAPEEPKVEEEPKEDSQHVEVNVNNTAPAPQPAPAFDQASLASLLREVVRDIVRDEIARNSLNQPQPQQPTPNGNQTITGATFGGPLVVQYFNGGINGVTTPAPSVVENKTVEKVVEIRKDEPAPAPVAEPAPVVEEKKEEPAPAPVAEPAPAPVVEVKPEPRQLFVKKEPAPAKPNEPAPVEPKKYERISFAERLLKSESDVQGLYNEIKNEILSYGVKSRISAVGDTFRLHKKMYVRITVAGKSLKLYFALNPLDYANGTIPVQDASDKDMYQEIPLVFKVKSALSVRRCKELIQDVMEKDGLEQGEVGKVNWIKELKAELANEKKKVKEKE